MRRFYFSIQATLFLIVLAACGPSEPTPTPPYGLPILTLPADEAPHDFQAEWWYFNLHLTDDAGDRYTLHDVVFQVQQLESRRTLYVRQVGLGDEAVGEHHTAERLLTAEQPLTAEPGRFEIAFGRTRMAGSDGERYELVGGAGNVLYDLTLTSTAPPLLHDGDGLVDFAEAGITYYYTRPRLEVEGTVTTPRGRRTVTGLGWLDKQWGDFQPVAVFWDWASVQLDDGTDLMLTNLYDAEREPIDVYATLRAPGEDAVRLEAGAFRFEPTDHEWWSDRTETAYRTLWRVVVPSQEIDVVLEPLFVDSEFASVYLGVAYWEAGVDVIDATGTRVGQGFVELNWARTFGR